MKFVTFNIRRDNHKDKQNNFDYRKELIISKINEEKPDIIAFQEVLPNVLEYLKENLPSYTIMSRGRGKDFKEEAVSIAVRNETMEFEEFSTFWLSPEPLKPGSRFHDQSIFPRICSQAIIKDKKKDFHLRLYNTHLDHIGEKARLLGMKCILSKIKADEEAFNLPVILSGDFNEVPSSPVLDLIREMKKPLLKDATESIDITYHDYFYGRKEPSKIDYIFTSREFKTKEVIRWEDEVDGVFLSDHYPIEAIIEY